MRIRRKTPEERIKATVAERLEQFDPGTYRLDNFSIRCVSTEFGDNGMHITVELARPPKPVALSYRHAQKLAGLDAK